MCPRGWLPYQSISSRLFFLPGAHTTDSRVQLKRCPSLHRYACHSKEGGGVQFARTVGKYQLRDNKALYSLSSYTCPCTQGTLTLAAVKNFTATHITVVPLPLNTAVEENGHLCLLFFFFLSLLQVGLLFLKVGSKVG